MVGGGGGGGVGQWGDGKGGGGKLTNVGLHKRHEPYTKVKVYHTTLLST